MKSFKFFFLSLVFLFAASTTTYAQDRELTEEQKTQLEAELQEYADALNLSEDQKEAYEAISRDYFEGIAALKEDGGSRMSKYKQLKALNAEKDDKMKDLLSEEQYAVYEDKQKERKEKARARYKSRKG